MRLASGCWLNLTAQFTLSIDKCQSWDVVNNTFLDRAMFNLNHGMLISQLKQHLA